MFPKAVQNLIEAYGMDMAFCEEQQKSTVNKRLLGVAELRFKWNLVMIGVDPHLVDLLTTEQLVHLIGRDISPDDVAKVLLKTQPIYNKTAVGWCMKGLDELWYRRCKLWWDIGILPCNGDRELIRRWIRSSSYWRATQEFCVEVHEYVEKIDDYLIGP